VKKAINKALWLTAQACPLQAWFDVRSPRSVPTEAEQYLMEQGQEVGTQARELHPDGIHVTPKDGMSAADVTSQLMADGIAQTLFEATVQSGPFIAKADILRREGASWHAQEVKSSFSDTKELKEKVADLAFTVMVLRRAGLSVGRSSLVMLSRNYRYGDPTIRLFDTIDASEQVNDLAADFETDADRIAAAVLSDDRPAAVLTSACRDCAYFEKDCLGAGLDHTVFDIPSFHHTKLKKLSADGIVDLSRLPDDVVLNEKQERAKYAALSGNTVVEPGLTEALAAIAWPCHYLDFETVMTFLPTYDGHGCHQHVITQFSIHHRDSIEGELRHSEFLADASKDCGRALAEALIEKLDGSGTIFMYSSFERQRINDLARAFPVLTKKLEALLPRLKDLLPLVEKYIAHPAFRGKYTIKKVLPALVPELSYKGMPIADGGTAIARFAQMARGQIVGEQISVTRKQLLEYCKMDTLAMVRLHETMHALAAKRQAGSG
jgi:hypothetical protein